MDVNCHTDHFGHGEAAEQVRAGPLGRHEAKAEDRDDPREAVGVEVRVGLEAKHGGVVDAGLVEDCRAVNQKSGFFCERGWERAGSHWKKKTANMIGVTKMSIFRNTRFSPAGSTVYSTAPSTIVVRTGSAIADFSGWVAAAMAKMCRQKMRSQVTSRNTTQANVVCCMGCSGLIRSDLHFQDSCDQPATLYPPVVWLIISASGRSASASCQALLLSYLT